VEKNKKEMKAVEKIVNTARSYLGEKEKPANSGFRDELFEQKMIERGFLPGDAWCALFLELVLFETYQYTIYEDYINRLCSKSAVMTYKNFRKEGPFVCDCIPAPGAGVIWQYYKDGERQWTGHAGIVTEVTTACFLSIEGNGNIAGSREGTEVILKKRFYGIPDTGLRILGFIHPANLDL
jgi:hypothetical protein